MSRVETHIFVVHKDGSVLKVASYIYADRVSHECYYHSTGLYRYRVYVDDVTTAKDQDAAQAMWELVNG